MRRYIVDAGPLVAFLSVRDRHHSWAKQAFASVTPPLLTCDAVLVEAWHLLRNTANGQNALLELLSQKLLDPDFAVKAELTAIKQLTRRYRDRPMSLTDACLVRLSELYDEATVMTVDSDFAVYRKYGRAVIPLIAPFA